MDGQDADVVGGGGSWLSRALSRDGVDPDKMYISAQSAMFALGDKQLVDLRGKARTKRWVILLIWRQ